jgi:hypothetical protein
VTVFLSGGGVADEHQQRPFDDRAASAKVHPMPFFFWTGRYRV